MLKLTKNNLKKLEELLEAFGYVVRYEKGNFNAGYCIVQNKKIAVINKFFDTEGRISCLLDIISGMEPDPSGIDEKHQKFFNEVVSLSGKSTTSTAL
jgi:hypothetical protein